MQRVIVNYLTREMAILGLVEAVLSFAAIYTAIAMAGAPAVLPLLVDTLPHDRFTLAAALTLVTCVTGLTIGLYRADICLDRKRLITTTGLAAAVAFAILLALGSEPNYGFSTTRTLFIAKLLGVWLLTMTLIRLAYGITAHRTVPMRRILLIGDPRQANAFSARLRSRRGGVFDPVVLHAPEVSSPALRQTRIWGVVVAAEPHGPALSPLLDCKMRGMRVLSLATFHEDYLSRIDLDLLTANDLLMTHGFAAGRLTDMMKRLSDIVIGFTMLILLLPLMALVALAIKIDSTGPVFYRQQRVGKFDLPFTLFKFRSMTADAEAGGRPIWAQRHDPRVTRAGRFIRATRIDELPQLVNVLRGEMSLVGPRPERPHFVEQLSRAIPFYRQRSYVKPGVTGWAQVNFPYGASIEDAREKLAYDLYYVKHRSFLLDAFILLSTIRVVLLREGAR
jgi:exopolysaccharide biosynthesis polyprenyl glycosylphosphotransferase